MKRLQSGDLSDQAEAPARQLKRVGPSTIAHWQPLVFAEMPFSSDQDRAERLNEIAWDNGCTRHDFARLCVAAAGVQLPGLEPPQSEAADPLALLRQLVRQMGKEAVKKLVDSL
jgi:hypothetical protein